MTKIEVQIYEIQDPREAEILIGLGVDSIGSVLLSAQDWKKPAIREAVQVSREAGVKHSLIPLFNQQEVLFRTIDYYEPHIIHFCESLVQDKGRLIDLRPLVEMQRAVKNRFPEIEIMRSLPVEEPGSSEPMPTMEIATHFETWSDCFLTDTSLSSQPVEGFIGITGQISDWHRVSDLVMRSSVPVILAGGLSPENVYEAIKAVQPFGVDSCTRTNVRDERGRPVRFKKDARRVEAFVSEVRRAERYLDDRQKQE